MLYNRQLFSIKLLFWILILLLSGAPNLSFDLFAHIDCCHTIVTEVENEAMSCCQSETREVAPEKKSCETFADNPLSLESCGCVHEFNKTDEVVISTKLDFIGDFAISHNTSIKDTRKRDRLHFYNKFHSKSTSIPIYIAISSYLI